jgi:hypothetical protein
VSRQVLQLPDVPPTLLTQATADTLYLTQAQGDVRYLQTGAAATTYVPLTGGSVLTGLLGPSTNNARDLGTATLMWRRLYLSSNIRAQGSSGTSSAFQGFTGSEANARFTLNVGGGMQWGPGGASPTDTYLDRVRTGYASGLRIDNLVAVGGDPPDWNTSAKSLQVGWNTFLYDLGGPGYLANNAYYSNADSQYHAVSDGGGLRVMLDGTYSSGALRVATAPSVLAGAVQTFTDRLTLTQPGQVIINTAAGQPYSLYTTSNVGVGVNPAAWGSAARAIQVGERAAVWAWASGSNAVLSDNTYHDGTNHRAIVTATASKFAAAGGNLYMDTAPSVAAGAVQTFTNRLMLDQAGNLGVGATPSVWNTADWRAIQVGSSGALYNFVQDGTTYLGTNTYMSAAGALGGPLAIYAQPSVRARWSIGGSFSVETAPSVAAGAAQTFTTRMALAQTGTLTLTPDAVGTPGVVAQMINGTGGYLELNGGTTGNIHFAATGGFIHPKPDNVIYLAHPSYRFITIYLSAAPIVGSSLDLKEDITPLDPAACVASVLETDWVDYTYKPPVFVAPEVNPALAYDEHDSNEVKAQKKAKRDEEEDAARKNHAKVLVETAAGRRQKGYILDSPDHKVGAQFGLPDRKNRSDGADLAVVACALQDALKRIAALEAA